MFQSLSTTGHWPHTDTALCMHQASSARCSPYVGRPVSEQYGTNRGSNPRVPQRSELAGSGWGLPLQLRSPPALGGALFVRVAWAKASQPSQLLPLPPPTQPTPHLSSSRPPRPRRRPHQNEPHAHQPRAHLPHPRVGRPRRPCRPQPPSPAQPPRWSPRRHARQVLRPLHAARQRLVCPCPTSIYQATMSPPARKLVGTSVPPNA